MMCKKVIFLPILIVLLLRLIAAKGDKSNPRILKECPLTEYNKFVECAKNLLLTSKTDQITAANITKEAETNCDKCNCRTCKAEDFAELSQSNCCHTCCPFLSCETKHCCFKTCHSLCKTVECRMPCRQSCLKFIDDEKKEHSSEQLSKSEIFNNDALNITTKINLTNVIHNVNNISAPINLDSSNRNDLTIERQSSYQGINRITNTPCCEIVSPTKCGAASKFPFIQCEFNKTSQCGESCIKNRLKLARTPCDFPNFGCGGLRDWYQIGYVANTNKSTPNNKYNESEVVNRAVNASQVVLPQEPTRQFILPQQYFGQSIVPSFNYPPTYYPNIVPRNYFNPYPISSPSNQFFAPRYPSPYILNPFYSSNMFYRSPQIYTPIYNQVQVPQIPLYPSIPNTLTYPHPSPYFAAGMQTFQNFPPQYNYQPTSYRYQSPQITFPPIYTAFAPPQVVGEIFPNPTIDFKVRPPNTDAEILITNKVDEK